MRFVLRCLAAALVSGLAWPASAAWHVAKSKHFIIYANESPKALTDFGSKLERFDQAVRYVRGMDDPSIGDGNRLTVFVLPTVGSVQKLAGDKSGFIAGFYEGHASGAVAFVPRQAGEGPGSLTADTIFFHEYAHHLMFQIIDRPLPEWVVEGFAEFMSTVRFEQNGDIGIGGPANHRAWGLFEGAQLPLESMLGATYTRLSDEQRESLYGRGWLLIHYLTFEKARSGQLDKYVQYISEGTSAIDAARRAFVDLKQLDKELKAYLNRSRITYLRMTGSRFQAGTIDVRPLSEGASKVILLRAQSRRGVDDKTAEPLAAQVRAVEARYPGDELVELALSEAEIDAGHPDAAQAAADRALKANPRNTDALVLKGRATAARADKLKDAARHAEFEKARALFITANKLDTEDPEPLMEFYKAYVAEGVPPNGNAIAALHYASDLAPQDGGLRMNSAVQYLVEKNASQARRALIPIAYDPHGGDLAALARTMIGKIDAGDTAGALTATRERAPTEASAH
jgi:tetratricopeptide (TPR) repeat protein